MPTRTPPPPDRGDPGRDDEEGRDQEAPQDVSQMRTAPLPPLPVASMPSTPPQIPLDGVDIAEQPTGLLSASPAARDTLRLEMMRQHHAAAAAARQRAAEAQPGIEAQEERVHLLTARYDTLSRIPARQRTPTDRHVRYALAASIPDQQRELERLRAAQGAIVAEAERHEVAADELRWQMETEQHRPPPWRTQRPRKRRGDGAE